MKKLGWMFFLFGGISSSRRARKSRHARARGERLEARNLLSAVTWATALGGSGTDDPVGITQTSDGGFAVVGNTTSFDAQNGDIWLTKFNASGTLLWTKTYTGSFSIADGVNGFRNLTFDFATAIDATAAGGVAITGYSAESAAGKSSGVVLIVDADGDLVGGNTVSRALNDQLTTVDDGGSLVGGNSTLTITREQRFGNSIFSTVLGPKTLADINGTLYGSPINSSLGHTTLSQLMRTSTRGNLAVGQQGSNTLVALRPEGAASYFPAAFRATAERGRSGLPKLQPVRPHRASMVL